MVEAAARREKYKEASFEKPNVTIRKITMKGQIFLTFSNTMYVPEDYSFINGESKDSRMMQTD